MTTDELGRGICGVLEADEDERLMVMIVGIDVVVANVGGLRWCWQTAGFKTVRAIDGLGRQTQTLLRASANDMDLPLATRTCGLRECADATVWRIAGRGA